MIDVVWDMETADPDDFLTLLLLMDHPLVRLKAVTITPGTQSQVGLVQATLAEFGQEIPVGAFDINHTKQCVSPWHERVYGKITPSDQAGDGAEILCKHCDENTTLVTGAPLKNIGKAIAWSENGAAQFQVGRVVIQGGFAGQGVVPRDQQLAKFLGRSTCATYNLNGDVASAQAAFNYSGFGVRRLVSKNVCHSVYYDEALHSNFRSQHSLRRNQQWIICGMEDYLARHPRGKKFHDPLAACCAIDESIGTWSEVEMYRVQGEWGAKLQSGTNTWIITGYDHEKFVQTLTM